MRAGLEQGGSYWRVSLRANAAPYIVNFKQADGPDQDGKISKSEFEYACAKGLVKFTDR